MHRDKSIPEQFIKECGGYRSSTLAVIMERDAKMVKVKILRGIVWPRGSNYINRKAVGKSSFDEPRGSHKDLTKSRFIGSDYLIRP